VTWLPSRDGSSYPPLPWGGGWNLCPAPAPPREPLPPPPPTPAGDFGFDPLGLGKEPKVMARMAEAELIHARYAMLAIPGCLAVEALGYGDWYTAPEWASTGGTATYLGNAIPGASNIGLVILLQVFLMGGVEAFRGTEKDAAKRMYPGGSFDPFGFSKGDVDSLKLKEIKNGRLAMLSFVGYWGQHVATGKGPVAALAEHLANPAANNFATNGVSVPFF